MSAFLTAAPEAFAAASADLTNIGSSIHAASWAAAPSSKFHGSPSFPRGGC